MPSFTEWASVVSQPTRRCKVCALPDDIYAEVVSARDSGYGTITISRYLVASGYEVTSSSLENHFNRGRHGR